MSRLNDLYKAMEIFRKEELSSNEDLEPHQLRYKRMGGELNNEEE